jgi:hypothetical protein
MIKFYVDDGCEFSRLLTKFKNKCSDDDEVIFKCYKNKLEFGCGYQKEIEKEIEKIYKIAHADEYVPEWWVELLD